MNTQRKPYAVSPVPLEWPEVVDMTGFVAARRETLSRAEEVQLRTPVERVYRPQDEAIAQRLRLDRGRF